MPHCPRCHQSVDAQDVTCPFCRTPLKAYGHPGIPLHRATEDTYLCDSCTYHLDDTCNFPQRPFAKECTLYQDVTQSQLKASQQQYKRSFGAHFRSWLKQYQFWLLILGLLLLSFLIAL